MDTSILTRIQNDVESNQVMLYMKGTPVFPQCGFSAAVVAVLNNVGVEYHSVNVLEDPGVRQGIKEYANWPTIPQLYVNGEFVGGCDIIREMYETGELTQYLTDNGVAVRPAA
ncbi:MAG: Grx4 family monothiol glutaredoxin [Alphaproteobacteria bacterium]|jgi:monothiol glutaredoxin